MTMLFWASALTIITLIFAWLWRYAGKIEEAEIEEQQWRQWVERMKWQDPYNAWWYEQQFEDRFFK